MARIFSHPFRLAGPNVVTVEQSSDHANIEQVAVLCLTKRGERHLVPTFGITDPAFASFDHAELQLGIALFGPPVRIREVKRRPLDDATQEVEVIFGD